MSRVNAPSVNLIGREISDGVLVTEKSFFMYEMVHIVLDPLRSFQQTSLLILYLLASTRGNLDSIKFLHPLRGESSM